jgi:hypothetical protein
MAGFFFVTESGEISNLRLMKDSSNILEFIENDASGK